ncbi:MAG: MBL fold metallo-hydrolase, partial [Bacteroidota bacterium]
SMIEWLPGIKVDFVYGHTEAMMILYIAIGTKTLVYCADLVPSHGHVSLPYVMAYDVRPLDTMKEKAELLEKAVGDDFVLFFEHDRSIECGVVKRNEKGRIVLDQTMSLAEALA